MTTDSLHFWIASEEDLDKVLNDFNYRSEET